MSKLDAKICFTILLLEAFILLVLATSWLAVEGPSREIQVLELFAGQARLARLARSIGLPAHAHDATYDPSFGRPGQRSAMDINESGGYLFLSFPCGANLSHFLFPFPIFVEIFSQEETC